MSKFIIPFSILLGSYLFQNAVILPLESMIRVDDNVDLVSLLFIPHGVKVALVLILGLNVLPAIFLAQLFNGIILENILNLDIQIILGALGGTLCFLPPLLLCNFYFRQSVFSSPIFQKMSIILIAKKLNFKPKKIMPILCFFIKDNYQKAAISLPRPPVSRRQNMSTISFAHTPKRLKQGYTFDATSWGLKG